MNPIIQFTGTSILMSLIQTCWMLHPLTPIKSCGQQLTSALEEVCRQGYVEKRTEHMSEMSDFDAPDYDYNYESDPNYDDMVARYAFRAKRDLLLQAYDKGLVDGCCKKDCTVQDLVNYCGYSVPIPRYIKALNLY